MWHKNGYTEQAHHSKRCQFQKEISMTTITQLPYMYRDASNYKESAYIFLSGSLTAAQVAAIRSKLYDGDGFIPFDLKLGIPELQEQMTSFPSDDDHVFHELELDGITIRKSAPPDTTPIAVTDFVAAFAAIKDADAWDIAAADERLGLAVF
jgi:hypothetical protein